MLRSKIMEMNISDGEKAHLLEILDNATKQRLENTLKKAKDYEESQESPLSLLLGCIVIAGIGLAINHFFSMTWPGVVSVGLAIIGVIGNISDRHNRKNIEENKNAAELIEQYRKLGYSVCLPEQEQGYSTLLLGISGSAHFFVPLCGAALNLFLH